MLAYGHGLGAGEMSLFRVSDLNTKGLRVMPHRLKGDPGKFPKAARHVTIARNRRLDRTLLIDKNIAKEMSYEHH